MMLAERLHGRPIPIPAPPYRMRRGSSGRQSFQAYSNPRTPYRMRPRGVARDRHGGRIPIPTSLRDATRPRPPPATTSTHSNPHIPTGCDGVVFAAMPYESIPIPTSLRDATSPIGEAILRFIYDSNPHIPTGCDFGRIVSTVDVRFQSPHPYGMRHPVAGRCGPPRLIPIPTSLRDATALRSQRVHVRRFQSPHPYGMRRLRSASGAGNRTIPIPTSLRDATKHINSRLPSQLFQSPHPYGMRPSRAAYGSCGCPIPIPTSLRDATTAWRCRCSFGDYSNPHIPTGCDRRRPCASTNQRYSNPHIPTGCDRNNYCMNPPRPTTSRTKREPQPSHRTKAAPQLPNHGANLVREACLPRVRAPKRDAPGWSAGRARIFPRSRFTPPASSASVARSTHRRTPRTSTGSSRCSRCASS